MTPQERDLITQLIDRLRQRAPQPKDQEADALIRQAIAAQPDIPYLLVQTVLIQDMALHSAEHRIADLEAQVAQGVAAPPQAHSSFLGAAARSLGFGGPWGRATAQPAPAAAPAMTPAVPLVQSGGGGFLHQAAATAAGIAGGALLFEGIQSLFGPHYGGGFLGGLQPQPGLSETVINNYYGDRDAAGRGHDASAHDDADGVQNADYAADGSPDDFSSQDTADAGGFDQGLDGGDGGSFDA